MVLPSLTMLFLFIHMVYKASKSTIASAESRAKLRGKMTRMVGAACIMLIVCFAPNQINYAMAMAGKTRLDTKLHHVLSLLVFVNSCLNPFIYGLSNKNYRHGYLKILFLVCPKGRGRQNRVNDGSALGACENVQDTSIRERNIEETLRRESQENNVQGTSIRERNTDETLKRESQENNVQGTSIRERNTDETLETESKENNV